MEEEAYFSRFDADNVTTLTGTVKEFQWTNPHAKTVLTVTNDDGEADEWVIEMSGPSRLARSGWRPLTLAPGMMITVNIRPLRDGSNGGHLLVAVLPDDTQMSGGRDRRPLLQALRNRITAAETDLEEFVKRQRLLGCAL
jgi:hypothetical protein